MSGESDLPQQGHPIPVEYFRLVAEHTIDWEVWMSPAGKPLWINRAVERLTGYTPAECLAMLDFPLPLVAPEDRGWMADYVWRSLTGETEEDVEFSVLHRDGSLRRMSVSSQPMRDNEGRLLGARVSIRDVSERYRLRRQLRLQNEHLEQLVQERTAEIAKLQRHRMEIQKLAALGELSAGVAHEINNPLAGIRNAFALLRRHLPPDVKHYDKLELIDKEIERISGITHQMYQLYRPSGQKATTFSVRRLVDESIALTLPMAKKHRVTLESDFDGVTDDEIESREGELKQILLNLLRNAIQASEPEQTVIVEVATDETHLTIRVKDEGHGIGEEVIANIFDPFFSTKMQGAGSGMGLGLSVTRGLIESMGGSVAVDSTVGQGTRFTVELPRRLVEDTANAIPTRSRDV